MQNGRRLSGEVIAILAVGATLVGVAGGGMAWVDSRFSSLEQRMSAMEQRMSALDQRMSAMEQRMSAMEQRQARIEGLVEGAALFAARDAAQARKP